MKSSPALTTWKNAPEWSLTVSHHPQWRRLIIVPEGGLQIRSNPGPQPLYKANFFNNDRINAYIRDYLYSTVLKQY